MTDILSVNPGQLIMHVAKKLQEDSLVKPTEWSKFVKTGMHKERLPEDKNWWYVRSAAILRTVANVGPVGTEKLRHKYGGKKNRGVRPEHRYKASGAIIRNILQQLESSGLIEQTQKGAHKGRVITGKGHSLLAHAVKEVNLNGNK